MGKIDIDGDRLCRFLVASIKTNQRKMRESEKAGDWYGDELAMAARSSVLSVLQMALRARNEEEEKSACGVVDDGIARLALFSKISQPAWWGVTDQCCGMPYQDHIIYHETGDDIGILLCPFGRWYWRVARILLSGLPIHLRAIAKRSAKIGAPKWTHWTVPKKGAFR